LPVLLFLCTKSVDEDENLIAPWGGTISLEITIRNLVKYYDNEKPVVKGLNLQINDGELVTILGPSGCGKSTTMLMIAGIHSISQGEIYFDDQMINYVPPKDRGIGMVFQNSALYPNMTVQENIMFPLKNQRNPKVSKVEQIARASEAAKMVHLGDFLKRKPSQLSGGQQQRVAIARAIVKRPKLLLLDEPLSSLDANLRMDMREEIRRLQKELGITTVMVTHDQEEAMTMSDRIAIMRDGILQQYGTPDELYRQPVNWFVANFLGMPAMNSFQCVWENPGRSLKLKETGEIIPLPADAKLVDGSVRPGQQLILGFRPHQSRIWTGPPAHQEGLLKGVVLLVEYTGREKLLNLQFGQKLIKGYTDIDQQITDGQQVWMKVDAFKYLFDSVSEDNMFVNKKPVMADYSGPVASLTTSRR
jgi:ABC-type sugar transport system ATPase subunit